MFDWLIIIFKNISFKQVNIQNNCWNRIHLTSNSLEFHFVSTIVLNVHLFSKKKYWSIEHFFLTVDQIIVWTKYLLFTYTFTFKYLQSRDCKYKNGMGCRNLLEQVRTFQWKHSILFIIEIKLVYFIPFVFKY